MVISGTLKFVDLETDEGILIGEGEFKIIEPTKWHKLVLIDNPEFYIEFYK